jgi:hypothetical protein
MMTLLLFLICVILAPLAFVAALRLWFITLPLLAICVLFFGWLILAMVTSH